MVRPVRNETGPRLWGRTISNGNLAMAQGKLIASLPPTARISPDYPLVACLGNSFVGNSPQTVLEFRNVVAGELVRSVEIDGQRDDAPWVTGRPCAHPSSRHRYGCWPARAALPQEHGPGSTGQPPAVLPDSGRLVQGLAAAADVQVPAH